MTDILDYASQETRAESVYPQNPMVAELESNVRSTLLDKELLIRHYVTNASFFTTTKTFNLLLLTVC